MPSLYNPNQTGASIWNGYYAPGGQGFTPPPNTPNAASYVPYGSTVATRNMAPTAVLAGNNATAYNPNAAPPAGGGFGYGGGTPGRLMSGMHLTGGSTYSYQPQGINPYTNGIPLGYQYESMINPQPITVYGTQAVNKFGNIAGSPAQGVNAQSMAGGGAGVAAGTFDAPAGAGTGTYQDILNGYLASSNQNRQLDLESQGRNYGYQTGGSISDSVRRGMAGLYSGAPTFQTGRAGTVPAALLSRVDRGNVDAVRGINAGYDQRNSQFAAQVADIQLRAQNSQISQQQAAAELAERRRQFDASQAFNQQQLAQQRQLATLTRSGGGGGYSGGGGGGGYGGGGGGGSSGGNNPFSNALRGGGVRDTPWSSLGYYPYQGSYGGSGAFGGVNLDPLTNGAAAAYPQYFGPGNPGYGGGSEFDSGFSGAEGPYNYSGLMTGGDFIYG